MYETEANNKIESSSQIPPEVISSFFVGDIVEIPVTSTQDYMLFHILRFCP